MYDELKGWQTGIGALLGFSALIVGALWNFHLNRRRDDRLRSEEVRSVAAALYGEIILLRAELALLARILARISAHLDRTKIDDHFVKAHTLPQPALYSALAEKIGFLPSNLVLAVTEFHTNYQKVQTSLPLLVENSERGYDFSVLVVLVPARAAVQGIIPALRTIEALCSIGGQTSDPDMGMTDEIIESEKERFSRQ